MYLSVLFQISWQLQTQSVPVSRIESLVILMMAVFYVYCFKSESLLGNQLYSICSGCKFCLSCI